MALQVTPQRGLPPGGGPASISGMVVRAGTNEPLARATVTLTREAARWVAIDESDASTTSNVYTARMTTDEAGRFAIRVPAGRYALSAAKDGFVPLEYGRRGTNALGSVLVLSDRRIEDLILPLVPAGAISGSVSGPSGDILAAVSVQAYRLRYTWNGRRLQRVQTVLTNDLGEFRLFGLNPGMYYVAATYSEQAQRAASTGGVRLTPNLSNPDEGYPTFYFPDSTSPNQAQPVRVAPGLDPVRLNISLKDTRRFMVHGRAFITPGPSQKPPIDVAFQAAEILFEPELGSAKVKGGCCSVEFQFKAAPGDYVLAASAESGDRHWGADVVRVTVIDRNVENLEIPLYPGVDVSGRISSDRGGTDLTGTEIRLVSTHGDGAWSNAVLIATRDGAFTLREVTPGEYDVLVSAPLGAYVRSISGRGGMFGPLRIEPGSLNRVDIVMSSSGGAVEGRAITQSGDPLAAAQIVLVPEGQFRRRQDRYLLAGTDAAGHFEIGVIPPGNYTAFAFEEIEPGAYYDPEFSRRFAGIGLPVRAEQNGRSTIELKVISTVEAGGAR